MIANIGDLPYVIVIALVVLVGGSQLPKIARNVGLAGKEFRKAQEESEEEHAKAKAAKAAADAVVPSPAPLPPVPAEAAPAATANSDGSITLTAAQLDALLKSHEQQVPGQAN